MKTIETVKYINLPKGIEATLDGRIVTITGPRGTLSRNFSHIKLNINFADKRRIAVSVTFGDKRLVQCVNTVASTIQNLITGVTKGYKYTMRLVYAHYPINIVVATDKKSLEIRNYIGQKMARKVVIPDGVQAYMSKVKDELIIEGNDIEAVSLTSARINQSARIHNRDIRKFLDGIYVLNRTTIEA